MQSSDEYVDHLVHLLRLYRYRTMPRDDVVAALCTAFNLSEDEAEAVIARGVALGILVDDGPEVRAI